jgi:hypothetical protein
MIRTIAIAILFSAAAQIAYAQTAKPATSVPAAKPAATTYATNPAPPKYIEVLQTSITKAQQCKLDGGQLVSDLTDCRPYPVDPSDPEYKTKVHWRECNNKCTK